MKKTILLLSILSLSSLVWGVQNTSMRSTSAYRDVPRQRAENVNYKVFQAPGSSVNYRVVSPRTHQDFSPAVHALPVIAMPQSGAARAGRRSGLEAGYSNVRFPAFNVPFAAAKISGGRTAEQVAMDFEDETPVRQNTVAPPGGPVGPPIPLTGSLPWLIMALMYSLKTYRRIFNKKS